jgi:predicted ribosome quality control (RQC) complex YloA/Tae2 family protein
MWEFLNNLLSQGGIAAVVSVVVLCILYRHARADEKREKKMLLLAKEQIDKSEKDQDRLLDLYEKRLEDVKDERERYEELADNLNKSLDLLIKVLKKNGS